MTLHCGERPPGASRRPPTRRHRLSPGGVRIPAAFAFPSARWRSMRSGPRSRGARWKHSSPFVEVTSCSTVTAWTSTGRAAETSSSARQPARSRQPASRLVSMKLSWLRCAPPSEGGRHPLETL